MRFPFGTYLFLFPVFLFFLVASPLILFALPTSNIEGTLGLALTLTFILLTFPKPCPMLYPLLSVFPN